MDNDEVEEEDDEEEEEEEEDSLNPCAAFLPTFPLPSGKAVECFRFSAPKPELWPLGNAGTDCRKVEGGVTGAETRQRGIKRLMW